MSLDVPETVNPMLFAMSEAYRGIKTSALGSDARLTHYE